MSTSATPLLDVRDLVFGYPGRPAVLEKIAVSLEPGRLWTVVGPNGAGKSTLLRLMAGLLRPQKGEVRFRGRPLHEMSLRDRARRIAFLPQRALTIPDLSVCNVVLMGRYPHRTMGLFESAHDWTVAERAMAQTGVSDLADRPIDTLSGGEAQRAYLAAALAQEPDLLLLDEPTASLDIKHQIEVFDILRGICTPGGPSVVTVTHDINLASMFSAEVIVLHKGHLVAAGPPAEVLTPDRLRDVYEVDLVPLQSIDGSFRWLAAKWAK